MSGKIKDWNDCKELSFSKTADIDASLIISILESAKDRKTTADIVPINETTKETVFTLFYDSLREYLEVIALKKGYKIYNHDCFYHFLREEMFLLSFAELFNSLRLLRNKINYYGKKLSLDRALEAIHLAKKMIEEVKTLEASIP